MVSTGLQMHTGAFLIAFKCKSTVAIGALKYIDQTEPYWTEYKEFQTTRAESQLTATTYTTPVFPTPCTF